MDKEYMLRALQRRYKVLEDRYVYACQSKNETGTPVKEGTAAAIRTQCKRDLQILTLIEYLLTTSKSVFIDNDDAIDGFHKLVEPKERYRSKR